MAARVCTCVGHGSRPPVPRDKRCVPMACPGGPSRPPQDGRHVEGITMSFAIRSETAARLISNMKLDDLKQPGAVDRLMDLAESDGKLTADERTALKGALQTFKES